MITTTEKSAGIGEMLEKMSDAYTDSVKDFTIERYRFIHKDSIDKILREEMIQSDTIHWIDDKIILENSSISEDDLEEIKQQRDEDRLLDLLHEDGSSTGRDSLKEVIKANTEKNGYCWLFACHDVQAEDIELGDYFVFDLQ